MIPSSTTTKMDFFPPFLFIKVLLIDNLMKVSQETQCGHYIQPYYRVPPTAHCSYCPSCSKMPQSPYLSSLQCLLNWFICWLAELTSSKTFLKRVHVVCFINVFIFENVLLLPWERKDNSECKMTSKLHSFLVTKKPEVSLVFVPYHTIAVFLPGYFYNMSFSC